AYSTDHQNVGEGAAARVPRPRRDEVSGRQQGARGGRDGLVERGEREEPPYREDAPDAGLTAGSDKKGQGPADARVNETLGIGLVARNPQVARDERPEHSAPQPSHYTANGGRGQVDAAQRGDRGRDVE